jgi:hypothetical protein
VAIRRWRVAGGAVVPVGVVRSAVTIGGSS